MKKTNNQEQAVRRLFDTVFSRVYEELEDNEYYAVEDIIVAEIREPMGGVDDFMLTAYACEHTSRYEEPVINGEIRFCVYGGVPYKTLAERLMGLKSDILTITEVWHPEQTPGISFNGVYENDTTTYIGARYELRR